MANGPSTTLGTHHRCVDNIWKFRHERQSTEQRSNCLRRKLGIRDRSHEEVTIRSLYKYLSQLTLNERNFTLIKADLLFVKYLPQWVEKVLRTCILVRAAIDSRQDWFKELVERLTAEREVASLIPGVGPILRV